jgi:hypothetical protein
MPKPPLRDVAPGEAFGRWTVLDGVLDERRRVFCRCACGAQQFVFKKALLKGGSMGCRRCGSSGHSASHVRHGHARPGRRSPEYVSWRSMRERCTDPGHPSYPYYGARGTRVCAEWIGAGGFERFLAHVGPRPGHGYSIDRIDVAGHYEPGNVRWAGEVDQHRNRTDNVTVTVAGVSLCVTEWAERLGVKANTIFARLKRGWSPEAAVTTPLRSASAAGPPAAVIGDAAVRAAVRGLTEGP